MMQCTVLNDAMYHSSYQTHLQEGAMEHSRSATGSVNPRDNNGILECGQLVRWDWNIGMPRETTYCKGTDLLGDTCTCMDYGVRQIEAEHTDHDEL